MLFLREDTAGQVVMLGPFLDSVDGVTAKTALTIANTDIRLAANNSATFADKNSGGGTAVEDGFYQTTFDATDSATPGRLLVQIVVAGALPVWQEFMVLPQLLYDSLILGTDNLQVDFVQLLGTAAATPDTAGYVKVTIKDGTGTGEIDTASGRVAITEAQIDQIVDEVFDEDATAHQTQGTFGQVLGDTTGAGTSIVSRLPSALVSGRMDGSVGAMAADALTAAATAADFTTEIQSGLATSAALATVQSDTDNIQTRIPAALVGGRMDSSIGAVAAGVIGAAAFAANALDAVWSTAARTLTGIASGIIASAARNDIADSLLDRSAAVDTFTPRQILKGIGASLAGKLSGAATTTVVIRSVDDSADRITATVDPDGNRSSITLNL